MKFAERMLLIQRLATALAELNSWPDLTLYLDQLGLELDSYNLKSDKRAYALNALGQGTDSSLLELEEFLLPGFSVGDHPGDAPWGDNRFKLFVSHIGSQEVFAASLASSLASYGVHAFVAHETIKAGKDW